MTDKEEDNEEIKLVLLNNYEDVDNSTTGDDSKNKKIDNNIIERRKTKRERLYWVDCLRILASYFVIFIHCTDLDHQRKMELFSGEWNVFYFYYCVLKPCVPLFIMISGLLFLDPTRDVSLKTLYKKSIPRLLKNFFFWSTYYSIVDKCFVNIRNDDNKLNWGLVSRITKGIFNAKYANHLWYIHFCLGIYMFTPIYRELIPNKTLAWYTAAVSCICYHFIPTVCEVLIRFTSIGVVGEVVRSFLNALRLYPFTGCLTYFMFGYLLNTTVFKKRWHIYIFYVIGIAGFFLTPILVISVCRQENKKLRVFGDYMNFNVCMETVGIFMFFKYTLNKYLTELMKKRHIIKRIITTLSDCSFGIYLIHYHIYHILIKLHFHVHSFGFPILFLPLYSLIIFIICFVIIFLLRKIRIFKQFT